MLGFAASAARFGLLRFCSSVTVTRSAAVAPSENTFHRAISGTRGDAQTWLARCTLCFLICAKFVPGCATANWASRFRWSRSVSPLDGFALFFWQLTVHLFDVARLSYHGFGDQIDQPKQFFGG